MSLRLRANLRLLRLGMASALRNPGLRALAVLGFTAGAAIGWAEGNLAASTAAVLSMWLARAYGVAGALWMGYAANRDQNEREGAVLRSKPVDGAVWTILVWGTGTLVWITMLALAFLGAAIGQLPASGPASLAVHATGFLRAAPVVIVAATLGFTLSRLMRSPLGGVITMFAWFCMMGGVRLIPAFLQPEYSQNRVLYLGAAGAMLCLTGWFVERSRRGELRTAPVLPGVTVLALLGLTAAGGALALQKEPRPHGPEFSVWSQMTLQHVKEGQRTPGFWLPDGKGGIVRTAAHPGKILLVYLFQAKDLDAARMLPLLDVLGREYASRGVQPIAVVLSGDHGDAWTFAHGGYRFPIGIDLSTVKMADPPESSVALAYDVQTLPLLVVTDRHRRAREISRTPDYSIELLRKYVEERLAEEPR